MTTLTSKVVPTSDEDLALEVQSPDLESLIAFYVTTHGAEWSNREGWLNDDDLR